MDTRGAVVRGLMILSTAVAVGAAAWLVFSNLDALVIGTLAGAAGGFVVHRLLRSKAPRGAPQAEPSRGPDVGALLGRLVRINVEARVHAFPARVLERVERSIDVLRELVPEANDNYPSNSLTREVNRACTEYLPELVHRFAGLAPDQRASMADEATDSFDALLDALERARQAVRTRAADEMSVSAKFIHARFGEPAV